MFQKAQAKPNNKPEQIKIPLSGNIHPTEIPERPKYNFDKVKRSDSMPVATAIENPLTAEQLAEKLKEIEEKARQRRENHAP